MTEGSRGGKIIGHTKSGKPIYDTASHAGHASFSPKDHEDAASAHHREAGRLSNNQNALGSTVRVGTSLRTTADISNKIKKIQSAIDHHNKQKGAHEKHTNLNSEKSYRSESMSDQFFKSLGITVGVPSLIQDISKQRPIFRTDAQPTFKKSFPGIPSQRELIEQQLSKGMASPLLDMHFPQRAKGDDEGDNYGIDYVKDSHGEQFHSDDDKTIEQFHYQGGPFDRITDADEQENPLIRFGVGMKYDQSRTMSKAICTPKKEMIAEHKQLIPTLRTGSQSARKKEADKQSKELKEYELHRSMETEEALNDIIKGFRKSDDDSVIEMSEDSNDPELIASLHENSPDLVCNAGPGIDKEKFDSCTKKVKKQGKDVNEYAVCNASLKRSEMDELVDICKGYKKSADTTLGPKENRVPVMRNHESSGKFVKSAGPGGMVFDFGPLTGNKIADEATALLNQFSDPIQSQSARYQSESYQKSLEDYTKLGDAEHAGKTTPFGNIEKGWGQQLGKSFDEQVAEAHAQGQLASDPSTPAIKNEFNKTEMNLNGNVIKATSETDAALIEMMKAQGVDLSGMNDGTVVDASVGGKISVTAGEPLPEQFLAQ